MGRPFGTIQSRQTSGRFDCRPRNPCSVSFAEQDLKHKNLKPPLINKMLEMDVIEAAKNEIGPLNFDCTGRYTSHRFTVDYEKLHVLKESDSYFIPRMDDCIDSLEDVLIFFTLDDNNAPYHKEMIVADRNRPDLPPITNYSDPLI